MTAPHWKLEATLRRHRKSALALARASGLTKTTVYNIINNKSQAVELETLGKLLAGLEALTGERMGFDDLLERPEPNSLREAVFANVRPINLAELDALIPEWTSEEREENERAERELEAVRALDEAKEREREAEYLAPFFERRGGR